MKRPTVNFMLLWDYSGSHRMEPSSHWGSLFVLRLSAFVRRQLLQQQRKGSAIFFLRRHEKLTRVGSLLLPVKPPCVHLAEEKVCERQQLLWFLLASKGATAVLLMEASYTAASRSPGEWCREQCRCLPVWMEKIPKSRSDKSWLWSSLLSKWTQ